MSKSNDQPVARLGVDKKEAAYFLHILGTDGQVIKRAAPINMENLRQIKKGHNLEVTLSAGEEKKLYPITRTYPLVDNTRIVVIKI